MNISSRSHPDLIPISSRAGAVPADAEPSSLDGREWRRWRLPPRVRAHARAGAVVVGAVVVVVPPRVRAHARAGAVVVLLLLRLLCCCCCCDRPSPAQLRNHRETLLNVLSTMRHDPLVEWRKRNNREDASGQKDSEEARRQDKTTTTITTTTEGNDREDASGQKDSEEARRQQQQSQQPQHLIIAFTSVLHYYSGGKRDAEDRGQAT